MASEIIATPGAANANSYALVAEGDTYWGDRANGSAWTGSTADQKKQALIQATDRIDEEQFTGSPTNPLTGTSTGTTQALKFPRVDVQDEEGWTYQDNVIPVCIKEATLELARCIRAGEYIPADTGLEGFEEVQLGPLKVRPRHARKGGALPEVVARKIRHLVLYPTGGPMVELFRS